MNYPDDAVGAAFDIKSEMQLFEEYLRSNFPPKGGFLSNVSRSVIEAGGKRLRPMMAILFAQTGENAAGIGSAYRRDKAFALAAAVETLHTATLVHDDIIDKAQTRRGRQTVSSKYGTSLAVYAGDYLLVKAMSLLSRYEIPGDKLNYVTSGIASVCMGEVDQYFQKYSVPSFTAYIKRIVRKTGIIFGAACSMGAHCAGLSDEAVTAAGKFGMYFGAAFQVNDDLLDLEAEQKDIGKPVLHDLEEGNITLPVLLAAMKNDDIMSSLQSLYKDKTVRAADLADLARSVNRSGAPDEARVILAKYKSKALKQLEKIPACPARDALAAMLD